MRSTIYVDNQWRTIPPAGGMIPGTTLHATYLRDEKDGFKFVRIALFNQGSQPVKLGSCHVIELDVLQGLKKGDRVYLDSGGGWPCGCIDVTGSILTPSYKYEFWKELFLGSEDIAWARQVMQEDDLESGVPGANYSFGGVSAIELADRGEVFAFTLPLRRSNGVVYILCDPASGVLRKLALASNFADFELQPGARIETEEAMTGTFDSAQTGLEKFAEVCAERSNIKLRHSQPAVGWLSWYGYRLTVSAEEINKVADFINATYPGFGFEYMQIDLGYNEDNTPGKWFKPNANFPDGLEKFADDMRKRGFKPGIWCGLFTAAEGTVKEGMLKSRNKWFWEPHSLCGILDPTHQEAAGYMKKTLRYFKSLGMKYFKIDFINRLGRVDDEYDIHDKSVIRGAGAYRTAMNLICSELDPDDYFYACSNLTMHSVGLCSTSMSACDIGNTGMRESDFLQKFVCEQFRSTMSRYFVQNKLIMLTADAICIAPPADLEEARLRTLFVGISGGQVFLGDKFQLAPAEHLDLVRRVLPPTGKVSRPQNMFSKDYPDVLTRKAGDRTICSMFNFDKEARNITAKLPDDARYDVWNFFEQRYEGRFSGTFTAAVPGIAARHYAFTPAKTGADIIGTSFHITCGEVELSDIQYTDRSISGYLTRPAGDTGRIFFLIDGEVRSLELTGTGEPLYWEMPVK